MRGVVMHGPGDVRVGEPGDDDQEVPEDVDDHPRVRAGVDEGDHVVEEDRDDAVHDGGDEHGDPRRPETRVQVGERLAQDINRPLDRLEPFQEGQHRHGHRFPLLGGVGRVGPDRHDRVWPAQVLGTYCLGGDTPIPEALAAV